MKAIIYAGIGLFSVASVYGVVDYFHSQKKGTLDNLYKEDPVPQAVEKPVTITPVIPANQVVLKPDTNSFIASNKTERTLKKTRTVKRRIRLHDFSRGRIDEPVRADIKAIEKPEVVPVKTEEIKKKDEAPKTEMRAVEPIRPERKISLSMFSRAPLRMPVKKEQPEVKERVN